MDIRNPFLLMVTSCLTIIYVTGFTSPSSKTRYIGALLMVQNVLLVLISPSHRDWFTHPLYANMCGGATVATLLQYLDTALIQKWSYDAQGPVTPIRGPPAEITKVNERPRGGISNRLKFAVELLLNKRQIGTPWQLKGVPAFDERDLTTIPPRGKFLISRSIRCFICIILLDIVGLAGADTSQNHIMFDQRLVPFFSRLSEVSGPEFAIRVFSSIMPAASVYLLFQAYYSFLSVFVVGLHLSTVPSWPPLNGSFSSITSLRSVWSIFWHKAMGTSFTVPARYMTTNILRLPPRSRVGRYVFIMFVFQLSGVMHIVGDVAAGIPIHESGVMHWFSLQALGFVIEDTVAKLWHMMTGGRTNDGMGWQKIVGFVWVCAWMVWTLPVWTFPIARASKGEGILPFPVLKLISIGRGL